MAEQLTGKFLQFTEKALAHFTRDVVVHSPFIPAQIFPSRSKAKFSVSGTLREPCLGILDNSLKSQELLNCPLHLSLINHALVIIKSLIPEFKLSPYNIEQRKGELKGLILRCNRTESAIQVRFVLRSTEAVPRVKKLGIKLKSLLQAEVIVSANIQSIPHAILEGPQEIPLSDEQLLWDTFNNITLAFSPQSFSQVTPETAEALYQYIRESARRIKPTNVIDLFCGVGGISFHIASVAKHVCGVEISKSAIQSAEFALPKNSLTNIEFTAADASNFLKSTPAGFFDLLVCNPPRRGLSSELIQSIKDREPRTVLYSSCNMETLQRDIVLLDTYKLKSLKPFEMFPLTDHLEVVAELESRS